MNQSALDKLRELAGVMMELGLGESTYSARTIQDDPQWHNMARNRESAASMWAELHDSVVAEVGSGLTRCVPHWNVDWEPMIVIGKASEFDDDYVEDEPIGWTPLAKAHRREAGWDFSPRYEAGTWIGWWEPESSIGSGDTTMVTGLLSAFIVVGDDGALRFAHTVTRRRREGIASRLVEYAVAKHGLRSVEGPLTDDGRAFVRARGL